jgi:diguanylate cyclase (GGDEF)-like protein/PAS domain S-box-containing protein
MDESRAGKAVTRASGGLPGSVRWGLATRITAGVMAILVLLVLAVGGGLLALRHTARSYDDSAREATRELRPLTQLQVEISGLTGDGYSAILGVSSRAKVDASIESITRQLNELVQRPRQNEGWTVPERRHVDDAAVKWRQVVQVAQPLLGHRLAPTSQRLQALAQGEHDVQDSLAQAEQLSWGEMQAARTHARSDTDRARVGLLTLALVAAILAAVITFLLSRSVLRPLRALRAGIARVSAGDLTSRVALDRSDELGHLGDAFDAMTAELQHAQQDLRHAGLHDVMTGLPNRTLLLDRIEQALHRLDEGVVALFAIDLDAFKDVNDSLGHEVGDAVLRCIGDRLQHELSEVDTVSRVDGDEFVVLVEQVRDEAHAADLAERLRLAISTQCTINGVQLTPSASVGVATSRSGDAPAGDLLRDADFAVHVAKQRGGRRCAVFESDLHAAARERTELERALRSAVHRNELVLYYQPTIELSTGRITGAEALLRWQHPEQGMIPPDRFIPLAEDTGIIVPLGRFVLHEACAQLREWQRSDPERCGKLKVNVNLSARQLERDGIVDDVRAALEQSGLDPQYLVLELTESILVAGDDLLARLEQLHELGVGLAVDDFGTGYSSLAYLRRLPIDVLKVDRSFVSGIGVRDTETKLASTIIQMGQMLGLTTVAEGIETEAQYSTLQSLGCGVGQGFYMSRPVPAGDFMPFVEAPPFHIPEPPERTAKTSAFDDATLQRLVPIMLNAAADAIVLVDAEGTLMYANEASPKLFGYSYEERIGHSVLELVHPDDLPGVSEALISTVATPGVKNPLSLRLLAADGTWMPVEIVSNNMLDIPSVAGIVVSVRDRRRGTTAAVDNVSAPERAA